MQRFHSNHSFVDAQAYRAMTALVQICVSAQESFLLGGRKAGHPVDVMVAVALDMLDPENGHQGKVLLERDSGLEREVLAAHEVAVAPGGAARAIDERLVQPLAGL